jgi:hypothetical protein
MVAVPKAEHTHIVILAVVAITALIAAAVAVVGSVGRHNSANERCRRDQGVLYQEVGRGLLYASYACVQDGQVQWHATGAEEWLEE